MIKKWKKIWKVIITTPRIAIASAIMWSLVYLISGILGSSFVLQIINIPILLILCIILFFNLHNQYYIDLKIEKKKNKELDKLLRNNDLTEALKTLYKYEITDALKYQDILHRIYKKHKNNRKFKFMKKD